MKPIITFNQVSKTFDQAKQPIKALDHVSFSIHEQDIFGVIGMSGAGKSTLVRCINFLERPDQGQVIVNNKVLDQLNDTQLRQERQKIGMIFQHFNLLSQKTVLENVMLPLKIAGVDHSRAQTKALELLELVHLADRAQGYPSQLSGGQKQRVAIARALANDPTILLSDEATSSLDPQSTQDILDLLREIHRKLKITIVMITHEMDIIESICDKVAILHDGQLVEIGKTKDVFSKPQSEKAKALILPKQKLLALEQDKVYRIIFDHQKAHKPIIADLILTHQQPLNILYANTRLVKDEIFGEMIVELPKDAILRERMCQHLSDQNIVIEPLERKDVYA